MTVYVLNSNQTTTGPGQIVNPSNQGGMANSPTQTLQVNVTGTGSVSATVSLQGSNDGVNFQTAATVTVASGASPQFGNVVSNNTWQFYRANITAITGTNAAVTSLMAL